MNMSFCVVSAVATCSCGYIFKHVLFVVLGEGSNEQDSQALPHFSHANDPSFSYNIDIITVTNILGFISVVGLSSCAAGEVSWTSCQTKPLEIVLFQWLIHWLADWPRKIDNYFDYQLIVCLSFFSKVCQIFSGFSLADVRICCFWPFYITVNWMSPGFRLLDSSRLRLTFIYLFFYHR